MEIDGWCWRECLMWISIFGVCGCHILISIFGVGASIKYVLQYLLLELVSYMDFTFRCWC